MYTTISVDRLQSDFSRFFKFDGVSIPIEMEHRDAYTGRGHLQTVGSRYFLLRVQLVPRLLVPATVCGFELFRVRHSYQSVVSEGISTQIN